MHSEAAAESSNLEKAKTNAVKIWLSHPQDN
jgi:hypothetical protein